jgi:hypothetical protein
VKETGENGNPKEKGKKNVKYIKRGINKKG